MYTGQAAKISGVYRQKLLGRNLAPTIFPHKITIGTHPQLTH